MLFDYFDALSGQDIYIENIGHFYSPKLKTITSNYAGKGNYSFYINFFSWEKEELIKYLNIIKFINTKPLMNAALTTFDVISLLPQIREVCREGLSFFIREKISWDKQNRMFVLESSEPSDADSKVGYIDRKNYEIARKTILQLNYKGLEEENEKEPKFASEAAKIAWDKCQKFEQEAEVIDKPQYHISNIVSKLCAIHPSYNLQNVFDLTIFQMYDAFFQSSYMKGIDLGEAIFSNHGGDKFNFEDWLKPISKQI